MVIVFAIGRRYMRDVSRQDVSRRDDVRKRCVDEPEASEQADYAKNAYG